MTSTLAKTIPVAQPWFGTSEEQAVVEVLRSGWITQGPKVAEFEQNFARYVHAPHAIAVSSCTTALHLALVSIGIKAGDEVLCPSLSYIATANAIVHAGGVPVFVDVDLSTYNMDPAYLERAITPRTRAVLMVHQIGLPSDCSGISEIARRHNLVVVEDAACAIGSEYQGQRVGLPHASLACFSFHPRKILTTGDGGMITTADESLAARIRRLRQHAMTVSDLVRHSSRNVTVESYDETGYNYRMTDVQAAIGIAQLRRLDEMLLKRRQLAIRYSQSLAAIPWLITPSEGPECKHNFQSYMVRLQNDTPVSRDLLMQRLLDRGVASRRGIMAVHREKPYRSEKWENELPITNLVTDNTIILPIYHQMTEDEQDFVIECIKDIMRGGQ